MAYEETCKILKWDSLVRRRDFLFQVECYKLVFNLNGLNFSDYFELCRNTKTRSNHPYKIQTKLAKLNCYKILSLLELSNLGMIFQVMYSIIFCDSPNVSKFKFKIEESYEYLLNEHFIFIDILVLFLHISINQFL